MDLRQRFETRDVVVTAHRGFSAKYPENTLLAFEKAIDAGADIIEFDLRGTRDHIPIVLHDQTIDRTSNGSGSPMDYTLDEIKEFNFSCWVGPFEQEGKLDEPAYREMTIPTFEELLQLAEKKIGLNIQVYATQEPLLSEICRLYDKYDLYQQGYLTMNTYEDGLAVRRINPDIELCILEDQGAMDRDSLKRQKEFGAHFIQPYLADVNKAFCKAVRELGLYSSMFYSNTDEDNRRFIECGQQGILTDCVDTLLKTIDNLGLNKE